MLRRILTPSTEQCNRLRRQEMKGLPVVAEQAILRSNCRQPRAWLRRIHKLMRPRPLPPSLWIAFLASAASSLAAFGATPVDFNRDVRPILSGTCFKCHGIDDAARKGK